MKTKNQSMKTIISSALAATVVAACLTINVQAKSLSPLATKASITAVSDTGKMAKDKMKMAKMEKKKMAKMDKDKMKMDKMKMDKMKKDTGSKM
jgi:phosphate-selective porin